MGFNIITYYNDSFGIDSANRINAAIIIEQLEEEPPTIDFDLDNTPEVEHDYH